MRRIHRLIAFLLAALWLPAVVHCGVETALELVEASGCCSHENDSGEASAGACTTDPCAVFDEGHFRTDGEATGIEAPLAAAWPPCRRTESRKRRGEALPSPVYSA